MGTLIYSLIPVACVGAIEKDYVKTAPSLRAVTGIPEPK